MFEIYAAINQDPEELIDLKFKAGYIKFLETYNKSFKYVHPVYL
jgi:hypothetical protein